MEYLLVNSTLDRINTEQHGPFTVFTEGFMEEYTEFGSFTRFIGESPWEIYRDRIYPEDEREEELTVARVDPYVREHTEFDGWNQMIDRAIEVWEGDIEVNDRARKRQSCHIQPVKIIKKSEQFEGAVVDISPMGVGLKARHPINEREWVEVEISPPDREEPIILRGIVRWASENEGEVRAGVELTKKIDADML